MTVLFLGSGPFGLPTLERLAALEKDLVVGTVPDAPRGRRGDPVPTVIKERAAALRVPCHEVRSLKATAGASFAADLDAELVIVTDFRLILGEAFLAAPRLGCYNLHGSLLPRWRGAAPVARGLLAGDRTFGVTLTRMVLELDAGPIVDSRSLTPAARLDAGEIEGELSGMAAELLAEWLPRLKGGKVPLQPQNPEHATHAPKLSKADGSIDWSRPPDRIEDQVLGLRPWPRAFSHLHGEAHKEPVLLVVDRVLPADGEHAPLPQGTVRSVEGGSIRVACGPEGRGTILLLTIQRPGRRSLAAPEFLRGFPLAPGDRFASPVETAGTR
ncbi:MAG: methionyl-tRNA formyltransferase [Planctomycetota bacterium]